VTGHTFTTNFAALNTRGLGPDMARGLPAGPHYSAISYLMVSTLSKSRIKEMKAICVQIMMTDYFCSRFTSARKKSVCARTATLLKTCEIVNKADYSQISQKTDCLTDVFVVFLSHFMQWPGYYLKLGHSGFLIYPVQFIIILH
jgi:hypothetical protein